MVKKVALPTSTDSHHEEQKKKQVVLLAELTDFRELGSLFPPPHACNSCRESVAIFLSRNPLIYPRPRLPLPQIKRTFSFAFKSRQLLKQRNPVKTTKDCNKKRRRRRGKRRTGLRRSDTSRWGGWQPFPVVASPIRNLIGQEGEGIVIQPRQKMKNFRQRLNIKNEGISRFWWPGFTLPFSSVFVHLIATSKQSCLCSTVVNGRFAVIVIYVHSSLSILIPV